MADTSERKREMITAVKLASLMLVMTFIFVFVVTPMLLPEPSGESQLSAYNSTDYDLSGFRDELNQKPHYTTRSIVSTPMALKAVENPSKTLFMAVGIEKQYSLSELDAIVEFIHDGGNVLLADDFGEGDDLSKAISNSLPERNRFRVGFLSQEVWAQDYHINASLAIVKAKLFDSSRGGLMEYSLIMNKPTGLYKGNTTIVETIAETGNESYIDLNENGRADIGERYAITMIARADVGNGTVVFVSDPDMFANALMDMTGYSNKAFAMHLVQELLPDGGEIIFDESRHAQPVDIQIQYQTIGAIVAITTIPIFMAFILVVLIVFASAAIFTTQQKEWRHKFDLEGFKGVLEEKRSQQELEEDIREIIDGMEAKAKQQLSMNRNLSAFIEGKRSFSEEEVAGMVDEIIGILRVSSA